MKTLVIITAYNRVNSLNRLINDLLKYDVDIVVFDDATTDLVRVTNDRVVYCINQEHRGKQLFWKTYQDIFDYCKIHEYDYYIIVPEDIVICDNFIPTLISKYEEIKCTCLCPLLTENTIRIKKSRWGNKKIKVYKTYAETYYFDCCGIVKRDFFENLNWIINPISLDRFNDERKSSGVGQQITTRLQELNAKLCHCIPSLCSTGEETSQMNYKERIINPLKSYLENYNKCVDVYIASIWREGHIIKTLKSVLPQPEVCSIDVSLNNYTDEQANEVISSIKDKRIKWHRTNNEKCSNEKLRFVQEGASKFVAFVDDDIIYPKNHFRYLIDKCNVWNGGVSLHGGILKQLPTNKYYFGRNVYRWSSEILNDVEADIIADCASLFKREWLSNEEWKALYDDATDTSMDDIYISCAMNKHNILCYVVAHTGKELLHKEKKESDNYVADKYCNNDSVQCEYINANYHRIFIPDTNGAYTDKQRHIVQRYQKKYPACDVWIEGRSLCIRRKGRTGAPTRYTL